MKMFPHPITKSGNRTKGYSLDVIFARFGVPCESEYPQMLLKEGS